METLPVNKRTINFRINALLMLKWRYEIRKSCLFFLLKSSKKRSRQDVTNVKQRVNQRTEDLTTALSRLQLVRILIMLLLTFLFPKKDACL